jgi:hypothetical protein
VINKNATWIADKTENALIISASVAKDGMGLNVK